MTTTIIEYGCKIRNVPF